jgi:hypothetical protein
MSSMMMGRKCIEMLSSVESIGLATSVPSLKKGLGSSIKMLSCSNLLKKTKEIKNGLKLQKILKVEQKMLLKIDIL